MVFRTRSVVATKMDHLRPYRSSFIISVLDRRAKDPLPSFFQKAQIPDACVGPKLRLEETWGGKKINNKCNSNKIAVYYGLFAPWPRAAQTKVFLCMKSNHVSRLKIVSA